MADPEHSCQPVTIKNRDKLHEKVGFLVKNRTKMAGCSILEFSFVSCVNYCLYLSVDF